MKDSGFVLKHGIAADIYDSFNETYTYKTYPSDTIVKMSLSMEETRAVADKTTNIILVLSLNYFEECII